MKTARTVLIVMLGNRLNNAYMSHLRAFINYQLSLADLTRKTFYDFKTQQEVY